MPEAWDILMWKCAVKKKTGYIFCAHCRCAELEAELGMLFLVFALVLSHSWGGPLSACTFTLFFGPKISRFCLRASAMLVFALVFLSSCFVFCALTPSFLSRWCDYRYTTRREKPGQDRKNRLAEQDRQNRTGRTEQADQDRQNRTSSTRQTEQNRLNRKGSMGQPE
jgi:hypothetical protein